MVTGIWPGAVLLKGNNPDYSSGWAEGTYIFSGCLSACLWHMVASGKKTTSSPRELRSVLNQTISSIQWQLLIGKWATIAWGKGFSSPTCTQRWREPVRSGLPNNASLPQSSYQCTEVVPEIQGPEAWSLGVRKQGPGVVLSYAAFHISASQGWAKLAGS